MVTVHQQGDHGGHPGSCAGPRGLLKPRLGRPPRLLPSRTAEGVAVEGGQCSGEERRAVGLPGWASLPPQPAKFIEGIVPVWAGNVSRAVSDLPPSACRASPGHLRGLWGGGGPRRLQPQLHKETPLALPLAAPVPWWAVWAPCPLGCRPDFYDWQV